MDGVCDALSFSIFVMLFYQSFRWLQWHTRLSHNTCHSCVCLQVACVPLNTPVSRKSPSVFLIWVRVDFDNSITPSLHPIPPALHFCQNDWQTDGKHFSGGHISSESASSATDEDGDCQMNRWKEGEMQVNDRQRGLIKGYLPHKTKFEVRNSLSLQQFERRTEGRDRKWKTSRELFVMYVQNERKTTWLARILVCTNII